MTIELQCLPRVWFKFILIKIVWLKQKHFKENNQIHIEYCCISQCFEHSLFSQRACIKHIYQTRKWMERWDFGQNLEYSQLWKQQVLSIWKRRNMANGLRKREHPKIKEAMPRVVWDHPRKGGTESAGSFYGMHYDEHHFASGFLWYTWRSLLF